MTSGAREIEAFLKRFEQVGRKERSHLTRVEVLTLIERFRAVQPVQTPRTRPPALSPSEVDGFLGLFDKKYDQAIERRASKPNLNVWEIGHFGEHEVEHCRVLHWLLDPRGSHSQGPRFLRSLLGTLSKPDLPHECAAGKFRVEREAVLDESSRIDLMVIGEDFLIAIEAKVNASPDPEQLTRYARRIAERGKSKNLRLFLSPRRPSFEDLAGFEWISWGTVARSLELFGSDEPIPKFTAESGFVRALARQYAEYLKRHVIEEDDSDGND